MTKPVGQSLSRTNAIVRLISAYFALSIHHSTRFVQKVQMKNPRLAERQIIGGDACLHLPSMYRNSAQRWNISLSALNAAAMAKP